MGIQAADAIVGALAGAGARLMFGVPGGGPNLDVVGAATAAGLRFVLAHGETAAAIMAASYADLTGAPGSVLVTRGPGLASAVNGIAHAALDRLPVVVIADTVPAADRGRISHQRIDQAALGRSVAKAARTVGGPHAAQAAESLVREALAAPAGPVIATIDDSATVDDSAALDDNAASTVPNRQQESTIVDAASDYGGNEAAEALAEALRAAGRAAAEAPPAAEVLAEALRAARRPVLLLGSAATAHTAAVRKALAGRDIPALHTYRARGILPDDGADAAGLVTGGTMEWPLLDAADLIVGLGVNEAEMIPARWDYAARTILVTGPEGSRGYFTGATALRLPLERALDVLARGAGHDWPPGTGCAVKADAVRRLLAAASAAPVAPGRLAPQQVAAAVRAETPPETIATVDAGAHMLAVMPLWEVPEPRRLLISSGLATMGYALPAAIAAALCAPQVPVVAFTGDGGLGMTLAEVETAVRLGLRIVVVVFNDAALSLIQIKQRPTGQGGEEAVRYRRTDFAAAAIAMGAAGAAVGTERDLAAALACALRRPGPTVIDASVDPACYPAVMDLSRGPAGRRSVPGIGRENILPAAKEHAR
jgi:acetolactate synthase I/II/III large subunit